MEKSNPSEDLKDAVIWSSLFWAVERQVKDDLIFFKSNDPLKIERIRPLSTSGNLWVYLIVVLQLSMIVLQVIKA
jgi:hypothetical protein